MNSGRTIFAQLMDLLPLAEFRRCVDRYDGDYKVQSFSCLDQFLSLAYAQLTYRESLRDIETCLRAHARQLYHMGFRGGISRNNLANANRKRDWRIYADFARDPPRATRSGSGGQSQGGDGSAPRRQRAGRFALVASAMRPGSGGTWGEPCRESPAVHG